jgi:nitrite reductase/ring-hydroxylating ferredoxin subunit
MGGALAASVVAGCGGRSAETVVPQSGVATISLAAHPTLSKPGGYVGINVQGIKGQILVFRSADGTVGAVSRNCPHFGCPLRFALDEDLVACRCHGSRFEKDGKLHKGPAKKGLTRYDVQEADGTLAIRVN